MFRQFLLRCISLFRPYEIISAESLRILLLAGAILLIEAEGTATLRSTLIHLFRTVPWYSIAEWFNHWYGLVTVAVIILAVSTRSPLVDRIRARDEAAKDANRLLAQLYGRLYDVTLSAYEYVKVVEETRTAIVDNDCTKATGKLYSWTYGGGLKPHSHNVWDNAPECSFDEEADNLDRACRELSDHLAEYRQNGLHAVANRLTKAVDSSLWQCSIRFGSIEPASTCGHVCQISSTKKFRGSNI